MFKKVKKVIIHDSSKEEKKQLLKLLKKPYKKYKGESKTFQPCRKIIIIPGSTCNNKEFTVRRDDKKGDLLIKCTLCGNALRYYSVNKNITHKRNYSVNFK